MKETKKKEAINDLINEKIKTKFNYLETIDL